MPERRDITVGRGSALVLASSVLVAGLAVTGGAFLGGYALGAPQPPATASPSAAAAPEEQPERVYTAEELRAALDDCRGTQIDVADGVAVVEPYDRLSIAGCVLEWFEAPGPMRVQHSYTNPLPDEVATTEWSNVTFEWEKVQGNRRTTITIE